MRSTPYRAAFAAILGALSLPALAGADRPAVSQDCSVCDDPTWPELRAPMPAIVIAREDGAPTTVLRIDPTWPELREPMPAVALGPDADGGPAEVQSDPTWPSMSSVAPALVVGPRLSEDRLVHR